MPRASSQLAKSKLFEIANSRDGFFTAKEAVEAGINPTNFSYHVNAGNWVREGHGIYRLAHYPLTQQSQYISIWLWTRDRNERPEGVFSHETALMLWDLTDLMPDRIHVSVPKNFRRSSKPPSSVVLHKEASPLVVMKVGAVDVVAPMQALVQLYEAETTSKDILVQGYFEGFERGLFTNHDFERVSMKSETRAFLTVSE